MKLTPLPWRQRGVSLLETLLYIIVIVAVAASAIGYFKASARAQKLANAVSEATDILQVAAQYWESNQTFSSADGKFDESIVIASGLLPTRYTILKNPLTSHIATPWTEINTASAVSITGQSETGFDLQFSGIPNSVCGALKQQLSTIGYPIVDNCQDPLKESMSSTVTIQVRKR